MIGTSSGASDIVKNGIVSAAYKMREEHIGQAHSAEHVHLGGNITFWDAYITVNSTDAYRQEASAGIHLGSITVTVEKPDTLYVPSPQAVGDGHMSLPGGGIVVKSGRVVEIQFWLLCRKKGESRVMVSIPMLHYDTVEFGFAKECTHVPAVHQEELAFTVGTATTLIIMFLVVACIASYMWLRRRMRQQRYKPVPQVEGFPQVEG